MLRRIRRTGITCAIAVVSLFSLEAVACGENLFRIGKGVAFRNFSAPLPGNVLIVASTEEERALAAALAASGHHVRIVASASDLAVELANGSHDVILAYFRYREFIEPQLASGAVAYVPVTESRAERRLADADYRHSVGAEDNLGRFLRAIHRTLTTAQS